MLDLPDLSHPGIAHGIGASVGLQNWPVLREQNVARRRPPERPPEVDANFGHPFFEVAPFAVEQILALIVGIERQRIDVDEIGLVDRVGPAQMPVVSMQHERCAGKETAGHMPAFLAAHHGLPPGDGPGERLVRIDEEPGRAVGRARRADRDGIGADGQRRLRRQERIDTFLGKAARLADPPFENRRQRFVETVKKWRLEHEAGGDVLAGQRQETGHHPVRVEDRVVIDAVRIGLDHAPYFGAEVVFVARVDRCPHPHQVNEIVADRRLLALHGCELAACGNGDFLDCCVVVFGMGEADPERGIRVSRPENMWYTPFVAADEHVVIRRALDQRCGIDAAGSLDGAPDQNDSENRQRDADNPQSPCLDDPQHARLPLILRFAPEPSRPDPIRKAGLRPCAAFADRREPLYKGRPATDLRERPCPWHFPATFRSSSRLRFWLASS